MIIYKRSVDKTETDICKQGKGERRRNEDFNQGQICPQTDVGFGTE